MAITINGSGITSANIADGTIVNADVNDVAASKLTGALPAISGASLTNLPGGGDLVHISTTTVTSAVSSVDFTLDSATYTNFIIRGADIIMANGGYFNSRFSDDGGATFKSWKYTDSTNHNTTTTVSTGSSSHALMWNGYTSTASLTRMALHFQIDASNVGAYLDLQTSVSDENAVAGTSGNNSRKGVTYGNSSKLNFVTIMNVFGGASTINAGTFSLYGLKG